MASTPPLTLLLVNEQAEEIKQTTISMRQFYPGCRVEAVYSGEEALEWAAKDLWQVILLDGQLPHRSGLEILPELRRCTPSSVIILQAEHHDTTTAAQALRAGADLYFYKKSPAFLTELPIVTRTALEHRELRKELDVARERHLCLIEAFPDLIYELNTEGRFVSIGSGVMSLLGYSSQELLGSHYSSLLHPDEWRTARHHVHERRTGQRARHNKALRLIGKHGGVVSVFCQTVGLYGQQHQFLGTVGVIKTPVEFGPPVWPVSRPYEQSPDAGPTHAPAPVAKEGEAFYPDRRRAARAAVPIEALVHVKGASFHGFVHDISLSDLYLLVEGIPDVDLNQPVQLNFSIDAAVLEVHGRIAEIREPTVQMSLLQTTPSLGMVIIYAELGAIEHPVLSSLIQELHARPNCVQLVVRSTPLDPQVLKKNL